MCDTGEIRGQVGILALEENGEINVTKIMNKIEGRNAKQFLALVPELHQKLDEIAKKVHKTVAWANCPPPYPKSWKGKKPLCH